MDVAVLILIYFIVGMILSYVHQRLTVTHIPREERDRIQKEIDKAAENS